MGLKDLGTGSPGAWATLWRNLHSGRATDVKDGYPRDPCEPMGTHGTHGELLNLMGPAQGPFRHYFATIQECSGNKWHYYDMVW